VRRVAISELTVADRERWSALHQRQHQPANPFCSPEWVITWLSHYSRPRDQHLLLVLDGDHLVGVAPLVVQSMRVLGVPVNRRLVLAGGGGASPLELPAVLSAPGHGRAVVRAVIGYTVSAGYAWTELSLGPGQGWITPGAFAGQSLPALPFQRHQRSRVCVIMQLGDTWPQTTQGLRRNVRESLRRARNRLNRDGRAWKVVQWTRGELDSDVVRRWLTLHAARASVTTSSARHQDAYAGPLDRRFMLALLPQLAAAGQASIVELVIDGRAVAAQLVLHAPGTDYVHSSGFEPDVWQFSPITALLGAVMESAIDQGVRWVNFSPGVNESKLRWSEALEVHPEFAYCPAGRAAGLRFRAYAVMHELFQLRVAANSARQQEAPDR
jgi:Acetyltransferase (GNAT) domain